MFGQKLLGLDLKLTREYKEALFEGNEVLRVGFTRLNMAYFFTEEDIDYVLDSIEFISKYGWMFLPHYQFDKDTGNWVNREEKESSNRSWLGEIDYSSGRMEYNNLSTKDKRKPVAYKIDGSSPPLNTYIEAAKQ